LNGGNAAGYLTRLTFEGDGGTFVEEEIEVFECLAQDKTFHPILVFLRKHILDNCESTLPLEQPRYRTYIYFGII
jgi:hypothetical protein